MHLFFFYVKSKSGSGAEPHTYKTGWYGVWASSRVPETKTSESHCGPDERSRYYEPSDGITVSAPSTRVDFGYRRPKAREEGADYDDYRRGLSSELSANRSGSKRQSTPDKSCPTLKSQLSVAVAQDSRLRICASKALAARTGSKFSRRNAIFPATARKSST